MSAQHSGKIREWFATHILLKPPAEIKQTYWEATHPHTGDPVEVLSPCHRRPMVKDAQAPGGWRCTHPIHADEERARIAAQSTIIKREKSGQFASEYLGAHPEMRKPRYPGSSNPPTPLPATRETGAMQPVARQTSGESMPTMRVNTGAIVQLTPDVRLAKVADAPTLHDGMLPQDHFVVVGSNALFEPMDKIPTARPLTDAEREAMVSASGDIFEVSTRDVPTQQTTGYLEALTELAQKSGLLPYIEQWRMEMPTAEVPTLHTKEQAERAAARRERYQLPEIEQRESE